MRGFWLAAGASMVAAMCAAGGRAQQPLGSVPIADAEVQTTLNGATPVSSGRASLVGASTVTAKPGRNAELSLARGGQVLVCQTSVLHATPAGGALVLALDRGAMEIRDEASAGDVVMTPDMRIGLSAAAPLDLRLRVTFNGDTCVENRGRKAPTLDITDSFGQASYQVKPGQHVLFEHGSLREVVDRETTPCGCPPEDAPEKPGTSIADSILSGGRTTPAQAAAAGNPFPAAQSDGLAAPPAVPETPGVTHTEISTTLTFDPNAPRPAQATTVPDSANAPAPAPKRAKTGPFAAIGRFFQRIFVH
jgi:hypothetical protein